MSPSSKPIQDDTGAMDAMGALTQSTRKASFSREMRSLSVIGRRELPVMRMLA
jgi:hypothetical protein